eukprot:COSAG01_NODE_36_length_34092_cov_26.350032_5_plen_132_part_00
MSSLADQSMQSSSVYSSSSTLTGDELTASRAGEDEEGRTKALLLERYLAQTLQEQQAQNKPDPAEVMRSVQSLLSFCLHEYALHASGRCAVRGRLLRKLADGYDRIFTHAMDLRAEERTEARDLERCAAPL